MITIEQVENEIENVLAHGDNREDVSFLANLYICREAMQGRSLGVTITTDSVSEFARCVNGRCFSEILPLLEELLDAVNATNPRLYRSFISRFLCYFLVTNVQKSRKRCAKYCYKKL